MNPGEVANGSGHELVVDLTGVRTGDTSEVTDAGLGTMDAGLGSGMDASGAETVGVLRTSVVLGIKPARGTMGEGFGTGTLLGAGMNPAGGVTGDLTGEVVAGEVGGEGPKVFSSGFECRLWLASGFCTLLPVAAELSLSSVFSSFLCSCFAADGSLQGRGRRSLVLPRLIRLASPVETSSFSSFFMKSCLKENMGFLVTLGTDAGIVLGGSGTIRGITGFVEGLGGSEEDFGGSVGV